MSNVALHSRSQFDPRRHFLRQDLIFGPPGAHLVIKWTKTLQDNKSHHVVQLPEIDNLYLWPVKALKALLSTRKLPSTTPLFATNTPPPFHQVIDTQIRQALKTILTNRNIDHVGHGFHTFRRLGATLAYDHSVPLQNIMSHGLWRSSTVWIYLKNASQAPSIIPTTFSSIVPKHL